MAIDLVDERGSEKVPPTAGLEADTPAAVNCHQWQGSDDPTNPWAELARFNWSKKRKWRLTLTACMALLLLCLNSTSVTVAAIPLDQRFHIDESSFPNSYWPVTSWNVGFAVVPSFASPLMEELGVRYGYLIAYAVFAVSIFPQAFARNFATLIIARLFSGGCAGILTTVLGGMIGDIWEGERERTVPMNLYVFCYMTGLALGPVTAGAILKYLHWRWILYIQAIIYCTACPIFIIVIEETRHSVILSRTAKQRGTWTRTTSDSGVDWKTWATWQTAIIRPLHMLLTEPVVFYLTIWSSFSLGTVFLFTQSTGQVYAQLYQWPESSQGLVLSALAVGQLVGCLVQLYQDKLYFRSVETNTASPGTFLPEARLYLTVIGSLMVAAGFFVYAWTSYSHIIWIVPTIGLVMVGFGSYTIVLAVAEYLTDAYSRYAASALAACVLGENMFAAFLPLSTKRMYTSLGLHWASSLLGFVALALTCVPVFLLKYGRKMRDKSPFILEAGY